MDGETLLLRDEGLDWREVEGEIVALDISAAEYFALNRSGALLWRAVARGATAEELTRMVVERYGLDEQTAAADVQAFVADIERRGLLKRVV